MSTNTSTTGYAIIADDHRMVAEGLQRLITPKFARIQIAESGGELLQLLQGEAPDLIIADLAMPDTSGLDVLRHLRRAGLSTPYIMLTMHGEPMIAASVMEAGANAYVLKSAAGEELLRAVDDVMQGRIYISPSVGARSLRTRAQLLNRITPKQQHILSMVGGGLRSKQIAAELGLSVRTVEAHKYSIMQVLGVHSTMEMVKCAEEQGLLCRHLELADR